MSNTSRLSRTRPLAVVVSAAIALSLAPGAPPAAGAKASPNLVVASASIDRAKIAEGAVLRVTHTVRNTGGVKAGATRTRFYLTTDVAGSKAARKASRTTPRSAPQDIRLIGGNKVDAVPAGKTTTKRTAKVTVPIGTAAGSYSVLACADDRGKVKEKSETDNCTVAAKTLKVQPAPGADSLVLHSFADTYKWPEKEDFNLQMMKYFCESVYAPERLSLSAALKSATSFLEDKVGAAALEKLDNSGQADTVVEAQELAGVAVAKGTPGLALASLMRAHGLEPDNGSHLINAAAVATSVGLPNEALAFLDAAQVLDVHRPAMGVSQQATALVVRGQALVMTGRSGQAEPLFLAAKRAEPLLSEADAGLATIENCKGNDLVAGRYVRKSRQREQKKDTTKPEEDVERPEPQIDLSFGKVTPLRSFPMADTPAQGVKMRPEYQKMQTDVYAEMDRNGDLQDHLKMVLRETDELRTRAEIDRRNSIQMLAVEALDDPVVRAANDKATDRFHKLSDMVADFFGGGTSAEDYTYHVLAEAATEACVGQGENCWLKEMNATCRPALTGAHSRWRALMGEMESALAEHLAAWSQRVSAAASNLEDEEAHRLMLLSIEFMEMSHHDWLVGQAGHWTLYEVMYEEECVAPLPAQVGTPGAPGSAQSSGPCPKDIAAMNWVAVLGPTKVKVTCEKVQQEISAEVLPLLHAFAEVSYDFRTGKMTVFAGSKGEGKLGVVEAGFKSGIYLTSDARGNIEDVGWRVGPSASITEGPAEYQVVEDMVDLSFVSGMRTGP